MEIGHKLDFSVILQGQKLLDDHIDYFAYLLSNQFGYHCVESWKVQLPNLLIPLDPSKEHIQILHSRDSEYTHIENDNFASDHWVCSFYNTKKIYIFDSARTVTADNELHEKHKIVLRRLYPNFVFNSNTVEFPPVQKQKGCNDCGIYAIAFAVSLALGSWPVESLVRYDYNQMRPHLIEIFKSNLITGFPIEKKINTVENKTAWKRTIRCIYSKKNLAANENMPVKLRKTKKTSNFESSNETSFVTAKFIENENLTADFRKQIKLGNEKTIKSSNRKKRSLSKSNKPTNDLVNIKKKKDQIPSLNENYLDMISQGNKLIDQHIYHFKELLSICSDYNHRDTLYLQKLENIEPVAPTNKHIQILYSGISKHWTCSFYDSKQVFIYDSLNKGELDNDQLVFLQRLYPFLQNNQKCFIFPKVQYQTNDKDCGVFAIAFAVSLLFRQKPEHIIYDVNLLRQHLLTLMRTNIISHFPTISNFNHVNLCNLTDIRKKERSSLQYRINRYGNDGKIGLRQNSSKCVNEKSKVKNIDSVQVELNEKTVDPVQDELNERTDIHIVNSPSSSLVYSINPTDILIIPSLPLNSEEKGDNSLSSMNNTRNTNTKEDMKLKFSVAKKIVSKYRRQYNKNNTIKLKYSSETYINKLMKVIDKKNIAERKLEAERIIKWCMCQRKIIITTLSKTIHSIKSKAEFHLSKVTELEDSIDSYRSMCGTSLHTVSTETYFYNTAYSFQTLNNEIIVINSGGQAVNILPLLKNSHGKKQWVCSKYCRPNFDLSIYKSYMNFLQRLKDKKLKNFSFFLKLIFLNHQSCKLGHYSNCYKSKSSCNIFFISIELLSPHFPSVRYIKRLVYKIKEYFDKLNSLDKALESANIEILTKITNDMKEKGNLLDKDQDGICLDEDQIRLSYKSAFLALTKRSLDTPRFKCISCQTLNFRQKSTDLNKLRKPINTEIWLNLTNYLKLKPLLNSDYICDNCLKKIRSNELPSTCILNNLDSGDIPEELSSLNDYEKILIQRAKVFQVVQRLGTISKKNLPHSMRVQNLKGRTFHLPLPLEETMKKLCSTTDPINRNHELYVLIRGIPTKSKIVWENLVNLEKVFKALMWLKNNNILYETIEMPKCSDNLIAWLDNKNIKFYCSTEDEECQNECTNDNNLNINNLIDEKLDDIQLEVAQKNSIESQKIEVKHNYSIPWTSNEAKVDKISITSNKESEEENKNLPQQPISHHNEEKNDHNLNVSDQKEDKSLNINNLIDEKLNDLSIDEIQKNLTVSQKLEIEHNYSRPLTFNEENIDKVSIISDKECEEEDSKSRQTPSVCNTKEESHKQRAMLTQILNDDNSKYENFTIYPLYDKRINDTSTNLYQMLKIDDKSLDNRIKTLDLQCFPGLYPYGKNGQHEDRKINLTSHEYIKSKLKSADSRFRLNQQYLFYLINDCNIRQLNQGIYHTLHVTNKHDKYTVTTYLQSLKKGDLEVNLTTLFARLRNSEQFWSKPRNNLHCMIRHYGPATWFLTVSPAEWLWEDLIQYIKDINAPDFDKLSPNAVIAADPVSVSRFIENKFKAFLDFLLSDTEPIGKISHYYWRREYQGRGIQHFHMIIWIEDAPILDVNTNEEVAEFIMKYVTCKVPNKIISPILHRRVTTHQQHYHNSYCLRTKNEKSGKKSKACKFGFPRPITDHFVLRDIVTSICGRKNLKSKSRLYDLPRSEHEGYINDYNPVVLTAWEGNMDIQFIGEKSTLLTHYVTKYTTKKETVKVADTISEINSTKSLPQLLWNIAFRSLNHREVGAPEAADTLLGISLYGTDSETVIKWLDVRMIRNRKLKEKKEIEELEKINPESTDIFCPSLIDDYYPNRPKELDFVSLYDFAKWYDTTKDEPKNSLFEYYKLGPSLYLKRRTRGYLINHYRYNVSTHPENYFYSLLLLFQPWRDTEELKNGYETYTESFQYQQTMLDQATDYHECNEYFNNGLVYIKNLVEEKTKSSENENDNELDSMKEECNQIEVDMIEKELKDVAEKIDDQFSLNDMINKMNSDQLRVFNTVKNVVQQDCDKMRLYVSGEGGTGKSFLISVIKRWIKDCMKQETMVTAPTGIAAFNINGLTIHRVFQLPVEHGYTPKYKQLSDNVLKVLRDQLTNVVLIIIDEISMVSNITLLYIHFRLVEIFNSEEWFGGKHILVFGDLLQLPPVHEDPTYKTLSPSELEKRVDSLSTINLWENLFTYDELNINMRQKTDQSYGELLSRVRIGNMTKEDIMLLEQRKINIDKKLSYQERLKMICNYIDKLPFDTICLMPTCKQCDLLNSAMMDKVNSEEVTLTAIDSTDCPNFLKRKTLDTLSKIEDDASRSAGLSQKIVIKVGAKIMLRRNIDVTLGLVNGAIGLVKSVTRSNENNEVESINIDLGNYVVHSIERISVKFQVLDKAFIIRKQFPICLSYGVTVHKSQGLSLKNAVIDAGNTIFSVGQTYVALSRVTTLEGIHLINFDPHAVKANSKAIDEYNRLRSIYRKDLPLISNQVKRWTKVYDLIWDVGLSSFEDDHNIVPKLTKLDTLPMRGIQNTDNISSCLISIVQCILHSQITKSSRFIIGESTDNFNWSVFIKNYADNKHIVQSTMIWNLMNNRLQISQEGDPSIIFTLLCEEYEFIRSFIEIELSCTERCKTCTYVHSYIENKNIITLTTTDEKKVYSLQELIDESYNHWYNDLKFCNNCMKITEVQRKETLKSSKEMVVLKLDLFSLNDARNKPLKKKFSIKSVPTAKISIGNNRYKLISAIYLSNMEEDSNHYFTIIRNQSGWLQLDDQNVNSIRWPVKSKNAYIFFLEITK